MLSNKSRSSSLRLPPHCSPPLHERMRTAFCQDVRKFMHSRQIPSRESLLPTEDEITDVKAVIFRSDRLLLLEVFPSFS